ncbi:MAG: ribose 5-phosphate isomerase B [Fimbriimonadaceae bacterium]
MKVLLGSDHAGYELRQVIKQKAEERGIEVDEYGAPDMERYDYPVAADELCRDLLQGAGDLGVLICGSGVGISMRANRHSGIRAALCTNEYLAVMSRQHNHANVLCLGGRVTTPGIAERIFEAFVDEAPSSEPRHAKRVEMLDWNGFAPEALSKE